MKILHVCTDEKFIDGMIDLFEFVYPGKNRFLIFGSKKFPLKYVKNKNVIMGDTRYLYFGGMKQDIKNIDVIIIHFLTEMSAYLALQAPSNVKIVWSGWGADYYRLIPKFNYDSILPETRSLIENENPSIQFVNTFKGRFISIINGIKMKNSIGNSINRMDYFSAPVFTDYSIVQKGFSEFSAKYIQLNYGLPSKKYRNPHNITNLGAKDILVGNSSAPTNNHIEIFILLKNIIPKDTMIVVPLSYGDEVYREKIIKIGYEMFAGQFQPLVGFLPLSDYQEKIASCSIVIMNHIRQQALGNIVMGLYAGKKVFLRKESVIYQYLTDLGVRVESVEAMCSEGLAFVDDEDIVLNNRAIIDKNWSDEVVINNTKKIKDIILDDNSKH